MLKKFDIKTKLGDVYEITDSVKEYVSSCGVKEGTCIVYTPHTTASIAVTSRMDPDGFDDVRDEISRPVSYTHLESNREASTASSFMDSM